MSVRYQRVIIDTTLFPIPYYSFQIPVPKFLFVEDSIKFPVIQVSKSLCLKLLTCLSCFSVCYVVFIRPTVVQERLRA